MTLFKFNIKNLKNIIMLKVYMMFIFVLLISNKYNKNV